MWTTWHSTSLSNKLVRRPVARWPQHRTRFLVGRIGNPSYIVTPNVASTPLFLALVVAPALALVLVVFRQIRGRRRGGGRERRVFSDFTFRGLWEQLAIIALARQSKCETYAELCESGDWRAKPVP